MKETPAGRPRRIALVALATAVSAAMLAALGGINVAQAVIGLAQYAYGKEKVVLCHKQKKTIRVGKPAVAAHLRHGDQVGTCAQVAAKKAAKLKAAKEKAVKQKAAKEKAAKQAAAKQTAAAPTTKPGNGPGSKPGKSAGKSGGGGGNGKGNGKK